MQPDLTGIRLKCLELAIFHFHSDGSVSQRLGVAEELLSFVTAGEVPAAPPDGPGCMEATDNFVSGIGAQTDAVREAHRRLNKECPALSTSARADAVMQILLRIEDGITALGRAVRR